ncbi:MAG TPA: PH domain-containing protein, partial [Dehalococcoidales bacterium]|nr:PH domain-containing protein [Dehalococcoidales bacterium]
KRDNENMRYTSGKSWVFGILVWAVIGILTAATLYFVQQSTWWYLLLTAAGVALLLWIWLGTYYEFRQDYLLAKMGPFFERIPYSRITSARKFKGVASSMALSSDMIELRHGKNYITGTTFISPLDRDNFLRELQSRCPDLKISAEK